MLLLFGYGNPLRRDDGAGAELARWASSAFPPGRLDCRILHQLLPETALEIAAPGVRSVLFVDAALPESACADAVRLRPVPKSSAGFSAAGHRIAPETLLALAGDRPLPRAWILTVTGEDFGFGEGFSEAMERRIPLAQEMIRKWVGEEAEREARSPGPPAAGSDPAPMPGP